MSVIIRLQNLPWSANALDIRNFFRGLSIPEGGVHIVGGELGDAFIAFSTDEDARQAMMLDGGKIKEVQVKLFLSSRSEMHKVIETARQSVPILTLTAPATVPTPAPTPAPISVPTPTPTPIQPPISVAAPINPFTAALGSSTLSFGIPGIGNLQEIPQPAVIEPPTPVAPSPPESNPNADIEKEEDTKSETRRSRDKDRHRSRTRSRSRDRKDRKRDRRDRSRSKERRRRDRSRSRDRRDRKRDRKNRSRSRDRSPSRRSRDRRKSPTEKSQDSVVSEAPAAPPPPAFNNPMFPMIPPNNKNTMLGNFSNLTQNGPLSQEPIVSHFADPTIAEAYNKLEELGKKRNPNAFQGDQQNGGGKMGGRGGGRGGTTFRRESGRSRFEIEKERECCVAIRNAPNHTGYGDVRRFFPVMIDKHGIKMINDNMGRRTGNIYVRFCDQRSKQLALQRKNNELKGEPVIVEHLDDELYDNAVDAFLPYREDNDGEDPNLIIIPDKDESSEEPFTVLKLEDLPHFVKEHDIIKAFSDFSLLSIMLNDCRSTRTKVAYIQFAKPEEAKIAFEKKDKFIFGRRQPTITTVSNEEYDKQKQPERMPEPKRTEPQEEERPRDPRQRRQQFDNGSGVQAGPAIQAQQQPFFPTPFVQQQAFQAPFAVSPFGGFPAAGAANLDPRTAAANWANRPAFSTQINPLQAQGPNQGTNTQMDDEPLDCVLMKGLPSDATDRTIVTFLSDTGAVPARIHLMLDTNGLPSGDCFCEFRSPQEARRAATKHGHDLDGCRVTVDLVTRGMVEDALEGPKQPEVRDSILGSAPQFFEPPHPSAGFASRGGFRGRGSFDRGGFNRGGFDNMRGGFDQGRGGFAQGRGNFDQERGSFEQNRVIYDRGGFRGRGRGIRALDRGGIERGRGRGFGRGRGGFENGRGDPRDSRNDDEPDPALEDFGAPGCVVSMENVPFRATVDDILNFFAEFELSQDDVIRRYNERGQPTGDARAAFRTPFDAQRAVKTRHMDMIMDRRISLAIL